MVSELDVLAFQTRRMVLADTESYILNEIAPTMREKAPDIMVLPEKWMTAPLKDGSEELMKSLAPFLDLSRETDSLIVPGSFSILRDGGLFNSSPAISDGKILGWQDKISLFRDEKKKYAPGRECRIFKHKNLAFTISVCYDSDFPYYSRLAAKGGSEVMLNPALIHRDFHDMWRLYVEARAIENRLPFVSVNSLSDPFNGGSMIVGPEKYLFGAKLNTRTFDHSAYFTGTLDISNLKELREERLAEDPGYYGFRDRN